MTFISYSQNFEDVLLWRALGHCTPGCYVDVGAQDPLVDSVGRAFHEAGWKGVHVEPLTDYAAALREAFPTDTVVEAALSKEVGNLTFYEIPGGGLSTARADIAEFHHEHAGHSPVIRQVTTTTLAVIFENLGDTPVHWLKIDVEGHEREVLEGWGSSPKRPWVVLVESTFPTTDIPTHDDWEDLVTARDYALVYTDGLNRYYLHHDHRDLRDKLRYPPSVFDNFELNGTATWLTTRLVRQHQEKTSEQLGRIEQLAGLLNREELERDELKTALLGLRRQSQLETKNHAIELERLRTAGKLSEAMERFAQNLESELRAARAEASGAQETRLLALERAEAAYAETRNARDELAVAQAYAARSAEHARAAAAELASLEERAETMALALQESFANAGQLSHQNHLQATRIAELEDQLQRQTDKTLARTYALHRLEAQTDAAKSEVAQLGEELALRAAGLERMEKLVAALSAETEKLTGSLSKSGWMGVLTRLGLLRIDTSRTALLRQQASLLLDQLVEQSWQNADSENERESTTMSTMLATDVNEMLSINGAEFVDVAYRTLLKRSPDRAGRDHFLERLRAGHGKEAVILAIADSAEARALPDTLGGLTELRARQADRRGSRGARAEILKLERTMNRLEFSLGEMHTSTARQSDRILERLDLLENQMAAISASGASMPTATSAGNGGQSANRAMTQTISSLVSQITETVPAQFIDQLRNAVRRSAEAETIAANTH